MEMKHVRKIRSSNSLTEDKNLKFTKEKFTDMLKKIEFQQNRFRSELVY